MGEYLDSLMAAAAQNPGFSLAIGCALAMGVLRVIKERRYAEVFMDVLIAGFASPSVVWMVWQDAPLPIYGVIALAISRWPALAGVLLDNIPGFNKNKDK